MITFGFVSGTLFFCGGIMLIVFGHMQNNDFMHQINSFWSTGQVNPGDSLISIGWLCCIIGAIVIVACLFAVLMKNRQATKTNVPSMAGEVIKWCPACGAQLMGDDLFCTKCGIAQVFSRTITCVQCGTKIDGQSHYCSKCGTAVNGGEERHVL